MIIFEKRIDKDHRIAVHSSPECTKGYMPEYSVIMCDDYLQEADVIEEYTDKAKALNFAKAFKFEPLPPNY